MRRLKWALIASVMTIGAANAADLAPGPAEPVAPVYVPYSWSGFYVGAEAGYVWGNSTLDAGAPGFSAPIDPKGAFGGVFAGYNYQLQNNLVLGVEADANFADAKSSNNAFSPPLLGETANGDLRWFGSARLRAGYALDRFLPFVTGGVAFADYSGEADAIGFGGTISGKINDTHVGWTIGAGLEYAITSNLTTRIEYRYSDYGHKSRSVLFAFPGDPSGLDLTTNDVRVGMSYKF